MDFLLVPLAVGFSDESLTTTGFLACVGLDPKMTVGMILKCTNQFIF